MASDGVAEGRNSGKRQPNASFHWVSSSPSTAEVAMLEDSFPDIVQLPEEELEAETLFWKQRAVLMRTLQRWVPVEAFIREFRRSGISGEIFPISLAHRSYIFRFEDSETRDQVLQRPWVVNGQPAAAEAWHPGFVPAEDAISSALLWIRLPSLPIEYWREEFLRAIISPAGQFICSDSATAARNRGGYARICARVELSSPLRPGTRVAGALGPFWQAFVYEQIEGLCASCGSIHLSGICLAPASQASASSEESLRFGAWMSAVRQRKEQSGSQPVDRRKEKQVASPGSSAPHQFSAKADTGRGMKDGGWSAPRKTARRRKAAGLSVESSKGVFAGLQAGSAGSECTKNGLGMNGGKRAGTSVNVPVSAEFQHLAETLPIKVQTVNPFALLKVDVGDSSLLGNRVVSPSPLKRARPAVDQAPMVKSKSDKKKDKGGVSDEKAKQVKGCEEQHSNDIQGSSEKLPRVSDSPCDPMQVADQGQGSGGGPSNSNSSQQSFEIHEGLIGQSQSSGEDIRSSEGLSDRVMVDRQGGPQLSPPDL